jgi:mRNA-degrading endonuclease YafQ of YafQ-DinJ toxin-antitoxin module
MKYRYRAVERFWTSFYRLSPAQKESARKVWLIFKEDPFDTRLRTHKIHRLSATYGRTIYAVEIEGDLRLLFYLDGETVVSLIVGTHDIYKG